VGVPIREHADARRAGAVHHQPGKFTSSRAAFDASIDGLLTPLVGTYPRAHGLAGRWSARAAPVNADPADKEGGRLAVAAGRGEGRSNGPSGFATFIVRVERDNAGVISGVVEWVRTGERMRFYGLAAIGEVIKRMVERAKW